MRIFINSSEIFEKKVVFYTLYKIFYIKNRNYIYNDIFINIRDTFINDNYKYIPEISYKNNKPIIKNLFNCSFKQKMVHHLSYFYFNEIDFNQKDMINIIKGDFIFINKSFELLKEMRPITIVEYKTVYEVMEIISELIEEKFTI